MKIPALSGLIRRRILLNYRVDPEVLSRILPPIFRPKIINSYAIAGICLIRLEQIRLKGLPAIFGISSENAAHRLAVEWLEGDHVREGVFIPRRDTDSHMIALAGGRIFSGFHHLSRFNVLDHHGTISMRIETNTSKVPLVDLRVRETATFPDSSVFDSLSESSQFFERGCVGYSSRKHSCIMDGLLLKVVQWQVFPLTVDHVQSAFFDDRTLFPNGSIHFDHALLMRHIHHEWHSEPDLPMGGADT